MLKSKYIKTVLYLFIISFNICMIIGGVDQKDYPFTIVFVILLLFFTWRWYKLLLQSKIKYEQKENKTPEKLDCKEYAVPDTTPPTIETNLTDKVETIEPITAIEIKDIIENNKVQERTSIFETYVACWEYNINKKDIKEYLEENDFDEFDCYTNKEILEDGTYDEDDPLWQYNLIEDDTITLIPEPNNEYDKNAIKVVHSVLGHIGYIPKKHNKKIANLKIKEIVLTFKGGKCKYIEYDDYKEKNVIKTKTKPYYFDLDIYYLI